MVRNLLGSVLALAGATAAVWSPFRAWYDGRHGRHYRLGDLFSATGVTSVPAELFASLFLPFAGAALITLAGLLLRSRLLVALAGVIVLAFTVLWLIRVGQAEGSLVISATPTNGLGPGTGLAFGGGLVLLLASVVLRGRAVRAEPAYAPPPDPTVPTLDGPTADYPRP